MASGGVALLGSFLPFVDVDGQFGGTVTAWGDGLFPIAAYVAIFGLLQALAVGCPASPARGSHATSPASPCPRCTSPWAGSRR